MLWHQRLGHPSDHYLFNAHKFVDGVPKFKHMDPVMDTCPTCIRAKITKSSASEDSTMTATQPFQGLSIDFMFSGLKSKDPKREKNFVGIKGETSAVVIMDHFTKQLFGDPRLSKASPIQWI